MKIRIRELFNKVLFFNKPGENVVKLKITEESKYLSIPVNTDAYIDSTVFEVPIPDNKIFIAAWASNTNGAGISYDNLIDIVPIIWIDWDRPFYVNGSDNGIPSTNIVDASVFKTSLITVPVNRRVVAPRRYWYPHSILGATLDNLSPGTLPTLGNVSPWATRGITAVKNEWEPWLDTLVDALGATFGYLVNDCEYMEPFQNWGLTQGYLFGITNDSRFNNSYLGLTSFSILTSSIDLPQVLNGVNGTDNQYIQWNNVVRLYSAKTLNSALWDYSKTKLPNLKGSNYAWSIKTNSPSPDYNGHPELSSGIFGTASSPHLYGELGQISTAWGISANDSSKLYFTVSADPTIPRLPKNTWSSFLKDQQEMRCCRRSAPNTAVQPWITGLGYTGTSSVPSFYSQDSRYYYENIYHSVLLGTEIFLLFNEKSLTTTTNTTNELNINNTNLSTALSSVNNVLNNRTVSSSISVNGLSFTSQLDGITHPSRIVTTGAILSDNSKLWRTTVTGPNGSILINTNNGSQFILNNSVGVWDTTSTKPNYIFFNPLSPLIATINPNTGILTGGTSFTITGTNLTGTSSVTVGGVAATSVTVVSATSVTAVTPAGSVGLRDIILTTPGGTATALNAFTYIGVPTISSISPTSGVVAGGTSITITGTNLTGTSSVTVGGVAATSVTVVSATSVTCITPAGSVGLRDIILTTPGGSVLLNNAFTYIGVPTITTINPNTGILAGGTSFTITGTNLTGTSSVTVGGVAATSVTVVSATSVTAVTPAGTVGAKNIILITPGGTVTAPSAFTYTNISLFPAIISITPIFGVLSGGTSFTITGTNLTGTSSVTVGGVAATSVTVVSATSVTAVTPAGTVGLQTITLTTSIGTATSLNAFTYIVENLDFARIQVLADTRISDLWVLDTTREDAVIPPWDISLRNTRWAPRDIEQGGYTSAPNGRLQKWTLPLSYTDRSLANVIKGTTAISGLCASLTYNKFNILSSLLYAYGGQTGDTVNIVHLKNFKAGITGAQNLIKRPYSFNDIKTFGLSAGHTLFGNINTDKTVNPVAISYNSTLPFALERNRLLGSLSQIDEWQSYSLLNNIWSLSPSWRFQREIRQNSIGFANPSITLMTQPEIDAVNSDTLNNLKILLDEYKTHYPLARSNNGLAIGNGGRDSPHAWRLNASAGYPMGLCGSFGVRTSPYPLGATLDFIPALGANGTTLDTWSPQGWTADTGMYLFDGWGMYYMLNNMIYLDGITSVIEPVTTTSQLTADSSWNNILAEVRTLFLKEIFDYVIHTEEGRAWYAKRKYWPGGTEKDSKIYSGYYNGALDLNGIWTEETGQSGGKNPQNHHFNGTGYWYPEPDNKGYITSNQNVTPMAYRMLATMYLYPFMTTNQQRNTLLSVYNMMSEECASVLERAMIGITAPDSCGHWMEGWGYASQSMPDVIKMLVAARDIGDRRLWDGKTTPDYFNKSIPGISYSSWVNNSWKWVISRIMPNNLIINSGSCNSSGWETQGNIYQFNPWGIYNTAVNASEYPTPGTTGSAISELHDWFQNGGLYSEELEYAYNVKKYQERNTYNEKINPPWYYSPGDCILTWKSEHVIPRLHSDWTFGSNVARPDGRPGYVVTNFNKPLVFGIWAKGVGVSDEKVNKDCGHISAYLGDAVLLLDTGEPRQIWEQDTKEFNFFFTRECYRAKGHNIMQLGEKLDPLFPQYAPWTGITFTATGGSAFMDATSNYNVRPLKSSTRLGSVEDDTLGRASWATNDPAWVGVSENYLYLSGTTQIANTRGGDTAQYLAMGTKILQGTEIIDGKSSNIYEPYQYQIKTCTRGITWEYSAGVAKIKIQDIVGISAFNSNPSFWTATGPYATGPETRVYYRFHTGYTGANDIPGNPGLNSWPFFTTTDTGLTFFSVSGTNNKTWQAAWTQPIPYNTMAYDGVVSRLDSVGVTMTFVGSQPIRLTKELSINHSFKYSSLTVPGVGITAPSRHYAINILLGLSGGVFHDEKNLTLNTTIDAAVKKRDNFTILYQDNITVQQENKLNALGAKKYYLNSRGLSSGWNLTQSNIDAAVSYLKGDIFEVGGTNFGRGLTATSKSFIFLDFESKYDPMTKTGGPTVDVMLVDGHTGPNGFTGPDDPTFDQNLLDGRIFGQTCANKYFYEWIEGGTSNNGTTFHGLRHYFPGCSFGNYGPHWWWGSSQWFGKTDAQIDAQLEIAANTLVAGCSAALKAFDIFSPSVYSNVNNRKHSRWNAAQNVRLYKKINAKMGTNKPIMPWVTPMYWHNGTSTPYTTAVAPTGYTGFESQYTPPFTFLLDSDIVYENAEPLIAEGADGVLIWNSPEYRSIQILGRPNCPTCSEFALIGFEGRTAQAVDGKYQQWPLDKATTSGASPAGITLNEWSFFTGNRQAISAHENYIKGRDMGVTGNRWWWKEISGSTAYTPPDWGNLNTNIQWNNASVTTGTTGEEIITRTFRDTFYNMAKVIKESYGTKDQWISGMTGPIKGLTGNRRVNGVQQ